MSNNTSKQSDWKQREVGALWKKKNEKGSYCTGYLITDELGKKVKQRVVMFSNKEKNNEKSPDFVIYLSLEQNAESAPAQTPKTNAAKIIPKKAPQPVSADNDDEIPDM